MPVRRVLLLVAVTLVLAEGLARALTPWLAPRLQARGGPAGHAVAWVHAAGTPRAPGWIAAHPTRGWTLAPGQHVHEGRPITVPVAGVRRAGPMPDDVAVVALGDSFTFGYEVADGEAWPDRLEARGGAAVVNLGVFGYGLDQVWTTWREQGRALGADVVIVGFVEADVIRTTWDALVRPKPVLRAEVGELVAAPLPDEDALWWRLVATPRLALLARAATYRPDADTAAARSRALLQALVDDVRDAGASPVLAWLPEGWSVDRWDGQGALDPDARARFATWCAALDAVCVDTAPAFEAARRDGVALVRGVHWTPAGHDLVAGLVAATVAGAR